PVTELKLAQEFVAGYEVEGNRVVIETSLEIARRLGYQTIAEGVEQEGEAEYLRSVGVDCIQGFLYGRPVPADEAFAMLLAQTAE
ncbi:MAG: EAL domain-containing protein, partial [Dehalococcoidia bacterium]|nr:EAL domain-containing protein [Dehalococcoidia bacterium]